MSPVQLVPAGTATQVSASISFSCALDVDHTVQCWGRTPQNGQTLSTTTPATVAGLKQIVMISARGYHSCALATGGAVFCWGDNTYGQLGDGTRTSSAAPVQVIW